MCSKFGVLMFEVFDVRYFGVRSKTTIRVLEKLNQASNKNILIFFRVNQILPKENGYLSLKIHIKCLVELKIKKLNPQIMSVHFA